MLSKKGFILIMNYFLLFFILQVFYQQSFSTENICEYTYKTFNGINDQNVSFTFRVTHALQETQYLQWMKDGNVLIGIYQSSSHDFIGNISNGRYKLFKGIDNTFEISIEFAQENDSGTHTIDIYDGFRSVCLAFRLTLKMYNTEPLCTAVLSKAMGKVEMSCRWIQVHKGDYAEIVSRKGVLSKEETGISYLGYVYREINTFSVYVTITNFLAGDEFPFECLVFHRHENVNKTCHFPSKMQHTIGNKQTDQYVFERCVPSELNFATWWYSDGGEALPLEFTQNSTLSNIHNIVFFYGEEDDNSNVIVHSMDKFVFLDGQFRKFVFLAESSKKTQRQAHPKENMRCENLTVTVNITTLTMPSTSTSTRHSASFTDMVTPGVISSKTCFAESKIKFWVSMSAGVASALGFIIGICFTKLYGKFREKYNTMDLRRSSETAVGVDNTESLGMTTILTQTSQPDKASLPHGAVSNQSLVHRSPIGDPKLDFLHAGRRSQSSLSASRSIVNKEDNSFSHLTKNCSDANFASSELLGKLGRSHEKSEGTNYNDEESRKTRVPSIVVGSGPSLEITYCSLDDIDGSTSINEKADLPSSSTPMHRTLRFNGQNDCKGPYSINEGTPFTPTYAQEDVAVKPIIDVEALYAKPDMSRKARKIHRSAASRGATKQHDQGDIAPVGDDWRNMRISMNQTNRVAKNDVGSDILVGPIYGNSASILNLEYKSAEEDAAYVNSSGDQYN